MSIFNIMWALKSYVAGLPESYFMLTGSVLKFEVSQSLLQFTEELFFIKKFGKVLLKTGKKFAANL